MISSIFFEKDNLKKYRYVIFGAGKRGQDCLNYFTSNNITNVFLVDNNIDLQGTKICNVEIKKPSILAKEKDDMVIIIAVKEEEDVRRQLVELGVYFRCQCISFFDFKLLEAQRHYNKIVSSNSFSNLQSSSKINLLYDHQIFSLQDRGGISRYSYEIISRVARNKLVCTDFFIGLTSNDTDFSDVQKYFNNFCCLKEENSLSGHQKMYLNNSVFSSISQGMHYDICHPTYYYYPEYASYKKLILTVHDLTEERTGMFVGMPEIKSRIIKAADGIIAVSQNTKRDIVDIYNIPEEKIVVIPEANSLSCDIKYESPMNKPYILFVGDRRKHKNFSRFIEAYSITKCSKELDLVCFGGGHFTEEEIDLIKRKKISKKVHWSAGTDEALIAYYQNAEMLVYPSLYEGFGLPVLEAMHFGIPVVASNVSSLPEVGGDAAYYVNPYEIDSIAEGIDRVSNDMKLQEKMQKLGVAWEKNFSWDVAADKVVQFYKTVLAK